MTKTKLLAAAGIVAGLSVAALPLTSYAAENVNINVTVGTGLQFSVDANTVSIANLASGDIDETMTTTTTVSTNNPTGYKITVIDADTNNALTSGTGSSAYTIPAASGTLRAGTAGWGIKGGTQTNYIAVPASSGSPATINTVNEPKDHHATTFHYGVATSPTQHSGTYTDTIIFTATTNS